MTPLTVDQIITKAGGPAAIEEAIKEAVDADNLSRWAIYKWPKIGIPDRHWPTLMRLAGVSADELLTANQVARGHSPERAAS